MSPQEFEALCYVVITVGVVILVGKWMESFK